MGLVDSYRAAAELHAVEDDVVVLPAHAERVGVEIFYVLLDGRSERVVCRNEFSAGEIPRIAGAFGLDTSTRANLSSAVYTAQTAINITKTVAKAAAA